MKPASCYLFLLLAFSPCALSEWKEDTTPPAVTVYTQFDHPYSAVSVEQMKQELGTLMGPLGLEVTWRDLRASRGNEVSVELVVVTFKGTCQMDDAIPSSGETGALGWTHVSDGSILPFSDVDCDKIRRFVAPEMRSMEPAKRDVGYGRAMGRVLAHELYHVFTNTTKHASWGVAKAFYTPRDLVAEQFQFQEKDNKALRSGKLKVLLHSRQTPAASFTGKR